MKDLLLKAGALVSAVLVAFCWQLGFILLSLGLGSSAIGLSVYLTMYKWVFVLATFVFLGGAYYVMRRSPDKLNRWSFYGTAVLSVALLIFTYLYR